MPKSKLLTFIKVMFPMLLGILTGVIASNVEKNISLENKKEWALVGYKAAMEKVLETMNTQVASDSTITIFGVTDVEKDTSYFLLSPKIIDSLTHDDFRQ